MEGRTIAGVALIGFGAWYVLARRAQLAGDTGGVFDDLYGLLPAPRPGTPPPQRTQSAGVPAYRAPATGAIGGSWGGALTSAGTAVGTGALAGAIGPGSIALGAATAGIGAGVALLSWAIIKKGLFRGGEVGIYTNPMRDNFLLQFGPGGWDMTPGNDGWPTSGAPKLAAMLTAITGEPDGSHYFKDLMGAESVQNELIPATRAIKGVLAAHGVSIESF